MSSTENVFPEMFKFLVRLRLVVCSTEV